MAEHLPILQIVLPLISAPVCVVLRRRALVTAWSMLAVWASFGIAVSLMVRVLRDGTIAYEIGGWPPPWGIEYRIDVLGAFMLVLVSAIGALVLTWSPASLTAEIPERRRHLFVAAFLLCQTGLMGIAATGDLFNVFVFLEISSLSAYALIAMGRDRRALTASFQYLVMGTVGATFFLIGVGLIYMMTGTLNMADMAQRVGDVAQTRTILAAFGFITVGLALKMALFPLHAWLPNAYTYAPSMVTAFLAATATKISVYVLIRVVFTVFGAGFAPEVVRLDMLLLPLALVGIFVASTVAIYQKDVKRLLAYSSVAQIGYMTVGISFATPTGLTGAIVHVFNHALTKGALFLAMGAIVLRVGSSRLEDLRGIGRLMPWTTAAWVAGGLSLIGVPLTAGFVSKVYLVRAALEADLWPVAALMLISSLLALVYVWRVVETAYFQEPPKHREHLAEAPWSMQIVTWLMVGATVFFGIAGSLSAGIARRAAELLLGVAP